jgi:hypothetical protein
VGIIEAIVDSLPAKLWQPANLYILPGGDWHFCTRSHPRLGWSVRSVEWRGREIAHGRQRIELATDDEYDMGEFVPLIFGWGYYRGHG